MILRPKSTRRRGTYAVEFAVVAQLFLCFLFAHILGGMAVFDYQQMSALTREGARWAAVHGYDYRSEKDAAAGNAPGTTAATTAVDIYNNAIAPRAAGVSINSSNVTVNWTSSGQQVKYYDYSSGTYKQNYVTVSISYVWLPLPNVWNVGSRNLTSTSTIEMTY